MWHLTHAPSFLARFAPSRASSAFSTGLRFVAATLVTQSWEVGTGSGLEVALFVCAIGRTDISGPSSAAIMEVAGLLLLCLDMVGADPGSRTDCCSWEGGELISERAVLGPVIDMGSKGLSNSLHSIADHDRPVLPVVVIKSEGLSSGMTSKLVFSEPAVIGSSRFTQSKKLKDSLHLIADDGPPVLPGVVVKSQLISPGMTSKWVLSVPGDGWFTLDV